MQVAAIGMGFAVLR